jgi:hypothetical protein
MKVAQKNDPKKVFDCPRDIGGYLIQAGVCVEVVPPPPAKLKPNTTWSVGAGAISREPVIHGHCTSCQQSENFLGRGAEKCTWAHCCTVESVPKDIQVQFKKLRETFTSM